MNQQPHVNLIWTLTGLGINCWTNHNCSLIFKLCTWLGSDTVLLCTKLQKGYTEIDVMDKCWVQYCVNWTTIWEHLAVLIKIIIALCGISFIGSPELKSHAHYQLGSNHVGGTQTDQMLFENVTNYGSSVFWSRHQCLSADCSICSLALSHQQDIVYSKIRTTCGLQQPQGVSVMWRRLDIFSASKQNCKCGQ